jgi:hypothetical protein
VTSARGRAHPALGISIRSRAARRDLHHLDPRGGQHRVERLSELTGPARPGPDQEPEPAGSLPYIHQQVPGLLHHPGTLRVRGHAQDMDMAGADFDHEEHYVESGLALLSASLHRASMMAK